jgi:hypothetical protein
MSFNETLKKVEESLVFKEFIAKYPDSELCAGFFIMDYISNDNKKSIDYKSGDKIFTFNLLDDGKVKMIEDELIKDDSRPQLEKISPDIKVEVSELKGISGIKILDEGISAKINKIIAVLQKYNGKQSWNLTCMLDGLIIINVVIDSESGEIIKFQRKSMMDMIRKK